MERKWWKEGVVYQIYPRSFMDSNGDGVGDLRGIIQKLDYIKELGVSIIWLNPVYKSPNDDNGYDISGYRDIMDEFGTMADWEELLEGLHTRGIKLIMDLVVNHSSDEHPWFVESRSSKDNPYRDYYVWRPGKEGKEPNNWVSCFSGSAWQYDETTDEYYLHLFTKKQPDLNWENLKVRQEIYDLMTFWLDKGIDGFRMDVINFISKVDGLPDAAKNDSSEYQWGGEYFMNGPRVHEFLHEMNQKVLSKYDAMTVGETGGVTPQHGYLYTHEDRHELNMIFQFEHMEMDYGPNGKWDAQRFQLKDLKRVMSKWQIEMNGRGWNSLYFNNHDQPRQVSRFGNDKKYRVESAKLLATYLHTLQGTPYVYQGEEIGMTNVAFDRIEDYKDVEILNKYHEIINTKSMDVNVFMQGVHSHGRDNSRTPMQWDDRCYGGFTTGTPWIKSNPNYKEINVAQALKDPDSVFYYYQKLMQLRKEHLVMVYGVYDLLLEEHPQIYAYTRTYEEDQLLIILNFSEEEALFILPEEIVYEAPRLLIGNYQTTCPEEMTKINLKPYEARVYKLK